MTAVTLSRNEVEALIQKATAGAGLSWGMAEEAGAAAGWMAARGVVWAAVFADVLEGGAAGMPLRFDAAAGMWRAADAAQGTLCPIALGVALCDFAALPQADLTRGPVRAAPVRAPVVLLPFVAQVARGLGKGVVIEGQGVVVGVTPEGQVSGALAAFAALQPMPLVIRPGHAQPVALPPLPPVPAALLARLERLAMHTTVPPSDTSRAGAGAAEDDND